MIQKALFKTEELEKKLGYGELLAKQCGYKNIIGVDEAGRGALAGPVVAACVYFDEIIEGVNDSKQLSVSEREKHFKTISEKCIFGVYAVDNEIIDKINILNATKKAMEESINLIKEKQSKIDVILIDGNQKIKYNLPQITIVKGDSLSYSIAMASIIAKVTRDNIMDEYDKIYPEYGFKQHKGYPTKEHIEALKKHGVIDIYRKTYAPVKELL